MDDAVKDLTHYLALMGQIGLPDPAQDDAVEILRRVEQARFLLDHIEAAAVRKARIEGRSWSEIGAALAVSRQAAHAKHST